MIRAGILVTLCVISLSAAAQQSASFRAGLADRIATENWISSLSGDYYQGAFFWSGHRSLPNPAPCEDLSRASDWRAGCWASLRWFAPFDVRRRTEPEYRRGWNSYVATPSDAAGRTPAENAAAAPRPVPPIAQPSAQIVNVAQSRDPYRAAMEYREILRESTMTIRTAGLAARCGFRSPDWAHAVFARLTANMQSFVENSSGISTDAGLFRRLVFDIWAEYQPIMGAAYSPRPSTSACLDIQQSRILNDMDNIARARPAR